MERRLNTEDRFDNASIIAHLMLQMPEEMREDIGEVQIFSTDHSGSTDRTGFDMLWERCQLVSRKMIIRVDIYWS